MGLSVLISLIHALESSCARSSARLSTAGLSLSPAYSEPRTTFLPITCKEDSLKICYFGQFVKCKPTVMFFSQVSDADQILFYTKMHELFLHPLLNVVLNQI